MPLHLITGSANAGKTGVVMQEALAAHAAGASSTLIVPSLADVRRIEQEFASKSRLGIRVLTFDQLVNELWSLHGDDRRLIGKYARQAIVGGVVAQARLENGGVAFHAPGFAKLVERVVAGVLGAQGTSPAVAEAVERYHLRLASEGFVERASAVAWLANTAPTGLGYLGLLRFDTLDGGQSSLAVGLAKGNSVSVALTWSADVPATEGNGPLVEALVASSGARHTSVPEAPARTELDALSRAIFGAGRPVDPSGQVSLCVASGDEAECEMAAAALRVVLDVGVKPEYIALVLPDITKRGDLLRVALAAHRVPAVVETHVPLGRTPYGRSLVSLLRLAQGGGGRAEALAFAQSPFSGVGPADADLVDRDWRMRRVARPEKLLEAMAGLGHGTKRLVDSARRVCRGQATTETLIDWQNMTDTMLANAAPGGALSEVDVAAHGALGRVVQQIAEIRGAGFSAGEVLRAIDEATVRVGGDEVPGAVRVMDARSVGARRFDVVVLGGLTEDEFPAGSRDEMEAGSGEWPEMRGSALRRLEFYGLVSRVRQKLVLIRQDADSDGRALRPSEFWYDVLDAYGTAKMDGEESLPGPQVETLTRSQVAQAAPRFSVGRSEAREAAAGTGFGSPLRDRLTESGGTAGPARVFSATEIEAYLQCPHRWFFERVVRPDEIDAEIDARELGTLAHTLLAEFYADLTQGGQWPRVSSENVDELLARFDERAQGRLRVFAGDSLSERLDVTRAVGWARNVVAQDAEFLPGYVPERFETSFGYETPFTFAGHAFHGKVDRIDVGEGHAFVTDYKTSREVAGVEDFADSGKVQAVVYAAAVEQLLDTPVSGSVYRSMRTGVLRGFWRRDRLREMPLGMCEDDALDAAGYLDLLAATEAQVDAAVSAMRQGRVERVPAIKGACGFCALAQTCEGRVR